MDKSEVGQFFGIIDDLSGVLQSLIDKNIFDNVEVFNYQALCPPNPNEKSSAFSIDTVCRIFLFVICITKILLIILLITVFYSLFRVSATKGTIIFF